MPHKEAPKKAPAPAPAAPRVLTPATDAQKEKALKDQASSEKPGSTEAVYGSKHPDHNPSKGVTVQTPGPEALAREKELKDAAKRTVYVPPGQEEGRKKE